MKDKWKSAEVEKWKSAEVKGMLPMWKCCQYPIPIPNWPLGIGIGNTGYWQHSAEGGVE